MRTPGFVLALNVFFLTGATVVSADQHEQASLVTFNHPVEVPGKILPAGTYLFRLMGSSGDRNIVEVFNANFTRLEDMFPTILDRRAEPSDRMMIEFDKPASGSPKAIKSWFFQGAVWGQRFVYPRATAVQIAKANNEPVYSTSADLKPYISHPLITDHDTDALKINQAPVEEIQPSGVETPLPAQE